MRTRYEIDCRDCGEALGETDDPREVYDVATGATGHCAEVTARGLVNRLRFRRVNHDRGEYGTLMDIDELTARFCDGLEKGADLRQILSAADNLAATMRAGWCYRDQRGVPVRVSRGQ